MLAELTQAHADLLACIDELERLTRDETPALPRLASVRWRLSRASGARHNLVAKAYDALSPRLSDADRKQWATLIEEGARSASLSSTHVGHWTLEKVAADWDGYRAASAIIRRTMRARILVEQRALYPLIDRASATP